MRRDPFGEHARTRSRARFDVLGGDFAVGSTDPKLLALAGDAFGRLPKQRFAGRPPRFTVQLVLNELPQSWAIEQSPPPPVLSAGAGLLCATVDAGNFAVVDVATSRALVGVSRAMLAHAYYARYELIEFAFLTLASRAQALVPLHAACIGADGKGVLLMGQSGAGKSTLSLHALTNGMQLLSEDSAFVAVHGLRVTGVPNYLHLAPAALDFLTPGSLRASIERSPVIQRRSGATKFELDLRGVPGEVARAPLRVVATVCLSRDGAGRGRALEPLERAAFVSRLRDEQPYAMGRENWAGFERSIAALPAYELKRTPHPDIAIRQLKELVASARGRA
jgi:energy-coupling factor transporter ATP-binding protein EcfA2